MFNKDKALQQLRKVLNASHERVALATIVSCEEETYTVQFAGSDLILPGVAPLIVGSGPEKIIVLPRLHSTVLVGSFDQKANLSNLVMLWVSQVESLVLSNGLIGAELTPELLTHWLNLAKSTHQ